MTTLANIFQKLTEWKKYPNYQMERRADIFFGFYMNEILSAKFGGNFDVILPEFPLWKERMRNPNNIDTSADMLSVKADYLCLDTTCMKAVLVELKTDDGSVRPTQLEDMDAAASTELKILLEDLVDIRQRSSSKDKYDVLLSELARVGLIAKGDAGAKQWSVLPTATAYGKPQLLLIKPGSAVVPRCDGKPPLYMISFGELSKQFSASNDEALYTFGQALHQWCPEEKETDKPSGPNLFTHARSELSQDAVLAWLCGWAAPGLDRVDPEMHQLGRSFLKFLFSKAGGDLPEYHELEVRTQYLNTDVVVFLKLSDNSTTCLLIEDKIHAKAVKAQLDGYVQAIKAARKEPTKVLPLLIKTWYIGNESELAGCPLVNIEELCTFFSQTNHPSSEIFQHFRDHLIGRYASSEAYPSIPITEWGYGNYYAFFNALRTRYTEVSVKGFTTFRNHACWFHGFDLPEKCHLYLQIDSLPKPQMTVRVWNPVELEGSIRDLLAEVKKIGATKGLDFDKPSRLSSRGSTVRVAELKTPFFAPDDGQLVDIEHVADVIQRCQQVLADVAANRTSRS